MIALLLAATVATVTPKLDNFCDFSAQIANGRDIARISPDRATITVTTLSSDAGATEKPVAVYRVYRNAPRFEYYTVPSGKPSSPRVPLHKDGPILVVNGQHFDWACPLNSRPVDTLAAPE